MENKELFIKALKTLVYSWGSDTPPEAVWAFNEIIDFYEAETGNIINLRLDESSDDNLEKIIERINRY